MNNEELAIKKRLETLREDVDAINKLFRERDKQNASVDGNCMCGEISKANLIAMEIHSKVAELTYELSKK